MLQIIDIIGWAGAVILLIAYWAVSNRRLKADGFTYNAMNALGSLGIGANSLVYADVVMAETGRSPFVNSTIASRHAGFTDCVDTADMFEALMRRLAAEGRIPPLP